MKLSVENRYSASVERAFASHLDKGVRERACQESGATSWTVTVTPAADGGATVQVVRQMSPNLPEPFARFVGDSISIHQTEEWSAPEPDGSRRAKVRLTIKNQPASMDGSAVLSPDGEASREVVSGEVKVAIPFVGRKVEPEIVKVIEAALRIEQRVGEEWLKSH